MTELKTLKDLKLPINEKDKDMYELIDMIQDYFHKNLKIEAVKWVKENRINEWYPKGFFEGFMSHFFNLTEEDLR